MNFKKINIAIAIVKKVIASPDINRDEAIS